MKAPLTAFYVILALLVGIACSNDQISGFNPLGGGKKKKASSKAKSGEGGGIGDDDDSSTGPTRSIDNSGKHFQVKDVVLLKSTIESCMGPDMTKIKAEMIIANGANQPAEAAPAAKKFGLTQDGGDVSFLLPIETNKVDADIIDVERNNLVDSTNSSRASVASDSLTDTYLRSLETVANVVAYNCSAENANCKCGTKKLARTMLSRCLPSLDPQTKEMDEAATMLGNLCAKNEAGMRTAIASMIASYAFASAR